METGILYFILVRDLLAFQILWYLGIGNFVEFKFQWEPIYGPEWNVEFSFSCKSLTNIFLTIGSNRRVILPNKIFEPKLAFDCRRLEFQFE